jgi:hypothetical protein
MVYGHVAVAALDEAEGGRMEEWSEDRVQEPTEHFLGDLYFPRKNGHVILGFLYCVIEGIG